MVHIRPAVPADLDSLAALLQILFGGGKNKPTCRK